MLLSWWHWLIGKWSPDVQCTNSTTHRFPFPNHRTGLKTLPHKPDHACCVTGSCAAVWSLSMFSVCHLEIGFDSAPVRRSLCAFKIWLEAFSLQSQELWLSCTVYSCWCDSSVLLSSSHPCSFSSFHFSSSAVWGSDFPILYHCNTLAKPFKALEDFPQGKVLFLAFWAFKLNFWVLTSWKKKKKKVNESDLDCRQWMWHEELQVSKHRFL